MAAQWVAARWAAAQWVAARWVAARWAAGATAASARPAVRFTSTALTWSTTAANLAALRTEVADVVGLNADRLVSAGRLTPEQHASTVGADFSTRQALIETLVPGSSFEMFSRSCNGPDSPLNRTAPVRQMQSSPGMLAIVRQLIGATDIK